MNIISQVIIFTTVSFLAAIFVNYKYSNECFNYMYEKLKNIIDMVSNIGYDVHILSIKVKYLFDKYGKKEEFQTYVDKDNEELLNSIKDNKEISSIINDLTNNKK